MRSPIPPQIDMARRELLEALKKVGVASLDPLNAPWSEVEQGVSRLLGGRFETDRADHQMLALGVAALLAERLQRDHQAFWFPNRESIEGAMLGFPDALIMLSPYNAVADAFGRAKLERLDDVMKEIRAALGQAKFGLGSQKGPVKLTPLDYQRLFDPGFVQFVAIDANKAKAAWDGTPEQLTREIRDALGRAQGKLPDDLRAQLEQQLVGALQRLEAGKPVAQQAARGVRVLELMTHLFGTVRATAAAPEELWQEIVMPLLYVGAPDKLPPLEDDELRLVKEGLDPFLLFLEVVPFRHPAPDDGLWGAIAPDELDVVHPGFKEAGSLRLLAIKPERLRPLFEAFDANKIRSAVEAFSAQVKNQAPDAPAPTGEGEQLFKGACELIEAMKACVAAGQLCLRRITEAEAVSEGALGALRDVLHGPRLIIT